MSSPWMPVEPVPEAAYASLRRRAIFDCCKWDPQVQDVATIAPFALVLREGEWERLARWSEALAREAAAAEERLLAHPALGALCEHLGLPRRVRRALVRGRERDACVRETRLHAPRLMRFDFHWTAEGWRISEANSDVPGGLNEAAGFSALFSPHYPGAAGVGDVVESYASALLSIAPPAPRIALVHATAYSDDQQVMTFLARRLSARGATPALASPADLRWREGRAALDRGGALVPLDLVVRFFPGEWLTELPADCGWPSYFGGALTPISNPASALLVQSKRFPLVWSELDPELRVWRELLPETRDPREVPWSTGSEWVLKPALGRIGEDVAIPGLTTHAERASIARSVRRHPNAWVAQRRFAALPLRVGGEDVWPCIGVFTIDARAAGAYGRIARRPLIDWRAQDVAVLAAGASGRDAR